jgi:hypothetical protein
MEKLKFIKPKLIKPKKLFFGMPVALFSLETFFGAIFGYLLTDFFSGKEAGLQGRIKSLAFDLGQWRIHFHHWMWGLGILISVFIININLPFNHFSYGVLGGMIFQGISCYPDWHRIIMRKKQNE